MTTPKSPRRPKAISDQLRDMITLKMAGPPEMKKRELARVAEVPEGAINRFLNGERGLSLETIDKLCRFLAVELRPIEAKK